MEELWDNASKFYYDKSDKDAGFFWKMYRGDKKTLQVSKEKAEDYIKNYKLIDYKELTAKFDEKFVKQLIGQSKYSKIVFLTFELEDMPLLLKIEKANYETIYLFSNFWGGCHNEIEVEMKPLKSKK